MSSILEALKKAEREATPNPGADTPWPAPMPEPSPYRSRRRRWLLPLGLVVVGCVGAVVFWRTRPPDPSQLAEPTALPSFPVVQASAKKNSENAGDSAVQATARVAAAPSVRPEPPPSQVGSHDAPAKKQRPETAGRTVPAAAPALVQPAEKPSPQALPTDVPKVSPKSQDAPTTAAAATAVDRRQTVPLTVVGDKNYRSDPRIELQALVWSPEAAARFVVINNRLIKEGASIDNISVVRINRDDVLLSEGADRWHEKFKIR